MGLGIPASSQFRLYIETQNVLYEGDGSSRQLATTTGSNRNGWTARLTVGVP